ncbi:MAG: site-specific DNA-methyltransferase [Deltaproteobacteria bacterium]|nr:site-specific DNA-methyltransferase [Deltaproteobacteria bacterium]MBW1910365.1 site-specific DNA-methyltransferase [Deltaproteobacteria bacterium]MBW2034459.1 site-specific DNA-methyltransferase [Deltaproteobacteria bacterium]MBW2115737.1 site-specific DNA-methyltransferase [Deltaproteobacteria bacterium]
MAGKKKKSSRKKPIEQYDHKGKKRVNNPPVGLVTPDTDKETGKRQYAYDPHIDPSLQWAGKAEHTSFKIPNVSLHVHERIDPRSIIEAVRKRNGQKLDQLSLFASSEENPPLREAIEFYKHKHNWSNRLVAGDSLLVMNSLLEKEGMSGKVQMIYIDPPYGIKYGSNFQPFVNKRDVKDGKDEDLTAEPEMIKAFRDTWELGIHSYLTYLRDRLLLARELLTESGSIFVQISDENVHRVRCLMDDVFGVGNFVSIISVRKTGAVSSPDARLNSLATLGDYIIWYAKDTKKIKYRQLYVSKFETEKSFGQYNLIRGKDGEVKRLTIDELKSFSNTELQDVFQSTSLESNGYAEQFHFPVEYGGKNYKPAPTRHWSTTKEGINRLISSSRIISTENKLRYIRYLGDFPVTPLGNIWTDLMGASNLIYVVQTNEKVISRCLLMTTDPGDLVFDPTCGSGTTAYVAEQWGRRWITCDTSRVALALAKQRLMTALYDYYELAHPEEGVGSGFKYKTVPHITLKSIANNEPPAQETLFDQPFVDKSRARVSGPFTVEAVPAPVVRPLDDISAYSDTTLPADESVARSGETLRHAEWRDELLKTGIRGKKGQFILFSRVEPLPGTRWLHAEAETRPNDLGADSVREPQGIYGQPVRAVISFGSEHAPLEQRQVELAIEEAQKLVPKPKIIVFAAFQFDPEAAKDIDETDWPGVTLLKAQMDDDLLTEDLKKKRRSNQSFWLMGQPDVRLEEIQKGKDKGKYRVEVLGFDYWNTKTGVIESGGTDKISIWMLDTDYDGRSLFPKQVFFPMSGQKDGWSRLAKNLKAEIDEELIEAYRGTVSLPFETGDNRRIAVKIVDDRGIESLKILEVQ